MLDDKNVLIAFAKHFALRVDAVQKAYNKHGNAFYNAVAQNKPEMWQMLLGD